MNTKSSKNKKVLLRERKRHTAGLLCLPTVLLCHPGWWGRPTLPGEYLPWQGGIYPGCGRGDLPWPGRYLPWMGGTYLGQVEVPILHTPIQGRYLPAKVGIPVVDKVKLLPSIILRMRTVITTNSIARKGSFHIPTCGKLRISHKRDPMLT